jgi:isopenicillin-N epimerase
MKDNNWEAVRHECHVLLHQAIERICELTALPAPYPLESDFYGQMGTAPLPHSDIGLLKSRLYDEYKIEIPLIQWQDKQFLRISVQGYNTKDDIDLLVEALKVLLPQVAMDRPIFKLDHRFNES